MKVCPIDGCKTLRGDHHVMCRPHWYMASAESRDLVWREYRKRKGSEAHRAAVFAAIEEVQEKLNAEAAT